MTSPPPPPDAPDDDAPLSADEAAVLAVLDDDATPDQRRTVARDPALRRRLDEARSARAALAAPVEPPAATDLAALRARAVAAGRDTSTVPGDGSPVEDDAPASPAGPSHGDLDQAGATEQRSSTALPAPDDSEPEGVAPSSPPDELAGRRARRGRRVRRLPPLPAVAAAALVLFVLGAALIFNDRSDDGSADASATAADATTEAAGDPNHSGDDVLRSGEEATGDAEAGSEGSEGSEGGRADQDGAEAPSTAADGPTLSYEDEAQLRRSLTTIDPATLAPPGASTPSQARVAISAAAERCSVAIQSVEPAVGEVQASLLVLVDGEETLVISNPVAATEDQPASTRLTVLEPSSCLPLFAVQR